MLAFINPKALGSSVLLLIVGTGLLFANAQELTPWMCGPLSLCQLAQRYGLVIDAQEVAKLAGTTPEGTSMKGLADAAYHLGMHAVGMKTTYQHLLKLQPPLLALVTSPEAANTGHYVVLDKVQLDHVEVWDSNQGDSILSREDFERSWDGYVLSVDAPKHQGPSDEPEIEIDQPSYDFGTLAPMEATQHIFTIRNRGQKPLEILEVEPSCTCETARLGSNVIPPGQTTTLDVQYRGTTKTGKARAVVYLTTNDLDRPRVVLSMVGIIAGVVDVHPNRFYLGKISYQESAHGSFVIHHPPIGVLQIHLVTTSTERIKTRLETLKDKQLLARVHFELLPGSPLGPLHETITVHTDAAKHPEVRIAIEGIVIGDLSVEPDQFFMGFVSAGNSVSRCVTLTHHADSELRILKIEHELPIVTVQATSIEPGKSYQLEATCAPTKDSPRQIRDVIQVYTNNPHQPVVRVNLYGLRQ